jgi:hypothetical protein
LDNKAGNKIGDLFKNITPSIPAGLTIYYYSNGNFSTSQYDDLDQAFAGAATNTELAPGNGVYVRNPGNTTLTVTFVGEVPQGPLSNPVPQGYSIKASQVPQAGKAKDDLKLDGVAGDKIYKWDKANQAYVTSQYDDLDGNWSPNSTYDVGEAFFLFRKNAGTWDRTFSVNQ